MPEQIYRPDAGPAPPEPPPPCEGYPQVWDAATLREEDCRFTLGAECLGELDAALRRWRAEPKAPERTRPDDYELAACRALMARVREQLTHGPGVALVETLPVERHERREATALYWLLGSLLGRPVAQDWQGSLLHEVTDHGLELGEGVRGNITRNRLTFHTDSSYALAPPEIVSLLCLRPAHRGGESRLISWRAVYKALWEEHPELVARGFRPFLFDRNNEHAPGEPRVIAKPVFRWDGDLQVCYFSHGVRRGYRMAGEAPDEDTARFLDAMDALLEREALQVVFQFRPGQLQFLNNAVVGHGRGAYSDHREPDRKRRLLRLWFREWGSPGYEG